MAARNLLSRWLGENSPVILFLKTAGDLFGSLQMRIIARLQPEEAHAFGDAVTLRKIRKFHH